MDQAKNLATPTSTLETVNTGRTIQTRTVLNVRRTIVTTAKRAGNDNASLIVGTV